MKTKGRDDMINNKGADLKSLTGLSAEWVTGMGKRLKDYLEKMEHMELGSLTEEEKGKIVKDLLIQIVFFQHERLIHLIVTVVFALLTMLSVLGTAILGQISLFLLTILFLVLLVPYVMHYYLLENGVQKLYVYYDKLQSGN